MSDSFRRPRLSVELTEEQDQKLVHYLDYGMRKAIFGAIVDDLISLIEKHGAGKIIGLLMERSISLREISRLKLED